MGAVVDRSCPNCGSIKGVGKVSALYYDCTSAEKEREWLPNDWPSQSRYRLVPAEARARKELARRLRPPQNHATNSSWMVGGGAEAAGGLLVDMGIVGLIVAGVLAFILLPLALFGSSPALGWIGPLQ